MVSPPLVLISWFQALSSYADMNAVKTSLFLRPLTAIDGLYDVMQSERLSGCWSMLRVVHVLGSVILPDGELSHDAHWEGILHVVYRHVLMLCSCR